MYNIKGLPVRLLLKVPFLFLVMLFLHPSLLNGQESAKETFYEKLTRAVVRIEEHQSICTPGREWSIERDVLVGTAFFVRDRLPGKSGQGKNLIFIVTARHVVGNHSDLFARIQTDPDSNQQAILLLPRELWVFHPSSTRPGKFPIDVAVMQISMKPFMKLFFHCDEDENPEGCGLNKTTQKPFENQLAGPPSVMERAIFFGFPGGEVAKKSLEPFARSGIVAYTSPNPSLRISGMPLADELVFYVDAPSFPGNSGGPVLQEPLPLQSKIRLWGLVTGSSPVGRDYAIITSVDRIHETIVFARSRGVLNKQGWVQEPPTLPIQCSPDSLLN
jgi:Trypsin-like peptidase domain